MLRRWAPAFQEIVDHLQAGSSSRADAPTTSTWLWWDCGKPRRGGGSPDSGRFPGPRPRPRAGSARRRPAPRPARRPGRHSAGHHTSSRIMPFATMEADEPVDLGHDAVAHGVVAARVGPRHRRGDRLALAIAPRPSSRSWRPVVQRRGKCAGLDVVVGDAPSAISCQITESLTGREHFTPVSRSADLRQEHRRLSPAPPHRGRKTQAQARCALRESLDY